MKKLREMESDGDGRVEVLTLWTEEPMAKRPPKTFPLSEGRGPREAVRRFFIFMLPGKGNDGRVMERIAEAYVGARDGSKTATS